MGVLDLLAAIAAAGIAVSALFLAHGRHGDDRGGPRAELVRYVGVAALSALVCGVMNVLETLGGGPVAAAVGNATNVFAPAMLWAAARRLNARAAIGAVSAGAGAILMLGVTFLVPLDDATLIKTAAIAVYGALAAIELRRLPVAELAGARIMAWTLIAFAVYNAGRLVVAGFAGMGSWLWHGTASAEITSIASAVVIALVGLGAVRMGRELDDDPAPGTRAYDRGALRRQARELLGEHRRLIAIVARLPEIDLIRAAHSSEWADTMLATLVDAVRSVLPTDAAGIPARDTVIGLVPADCSRDIDVDIRRAFAARMPGIGYDDTPDLSVVHVQIEDVAALSALMEARRLRPSARALHHPRG